MKSAIGITGIVLIFFVIVFLVSAPTVNDHVANKIGESLEGIPLPENTELVETKSLAGKLVGNGNGMQYLGVILIKSELTLDELKDYYAKYADYEWECIVEKQDSKQIKVIEHGSVEFQEDVCENGYYIVYSWGSNDTIFNEFDLRGH